MMREYESPLSPVDMWITCSHARHMGKMIQLRNVSPELHRTLKSRAALAGMSLSDYLIEIIARDAERPTLAEFRARLQTRETVQVSESAVDIIRQQRGPI